MVIQTIVSEKGTEAQKANFGKMEETSMEFIYLESHGWEWLARGREGTPPRWADIPLVRRAENIHDMEEPAVKK